MPTERHLLDAKGVAAAFDTMCGEIIACIERDRQNFGANTKISLVGIRRGGAHLAARAQKALEARGYKHLNTGELDITLYRDDVLFQSAQVPELRGTSIAFDLDESLLILIDDVLFTGRTIRAALDALTELGRPKSIRLAVLIDRGCRELPIAAQAVGFHLESKRSQRVELQLVEGGYPSDRALIVCEAS